eukprot:TRINITY_DN17501_c1_g1_i2.p1 TRINITY_DN17501_c1_g1~~TRINITY_DN17501_c1_g1_i2.p1  ORF type:complete len:805 (+),score=258.49 TRINITY_DN17501_c1_g1_i2:146-2416(+)
MADAFRTHLKDYFAGVPKKRVQQRFSAVKRCVWGTAAELSQLGLPPKALARCTEALAAKPALDAPSAAPTPSAGTTPLQLPSGAPVAAAAALDGAPAAPPAVPADSEAPQGGPDAAAAKDAPAPAAAAAPGKEKKPAGPSQLNLMKFFSVKKHPAKAKTEGGDPSAKQAGGGVVESYARRDATYNPFDAHRFSILEKAGGGAGGSAGGIYPLPLEEKTAAPEAMRSCNVFKCIFGEGDAADGEPSAAEGEGEDATPPPAPPSVESLREDMLAAVKAMSCNMFHDLIARGGPPLEILAHRDCSDPDSMQYCGSAPEPTPSMAAVWPLGEAMPRDADLDYTDTAEQDVMMYDDDSDEEASSSGSDDSSDQDGQASACSFVEASESEDNADEMREGIGRLTYMVDSDSEDDDDANDILPRGSATQGGATRSSVLRWPITGLRKASAEELIYIAGPLRRHRYSEAAEQMSRAHGSSPEVAPYLSCQDANRIFAEGKGFADLFRNNVISDWAFSQNLLRKTAGGHVDMSAFIPLGGGAEGGAMEVPKEEPLGKAMFADDCDKLWERDSLLKVRSASKTEKAGEKGPKVLWDEEKTAALAKIVHLSTHTVLYMVGSMQDKYPEMKKTTIDRKIREFAAKDTSNKYWVVRTAVLDQCGLLDAPSEDPEVAKLHLAQSLATGGGADGDASKKRKRGGAANGVGGASGGTEDETPAKRGRREGPGTPDKPSSSKRGRKYKPVKGEPRQQTLTLEKKATQSPHKGQ